MGTIAPIKDESILMTGILILDMMVLVCIDFWAGVIHRLPGCGLTGYYPLGFHRLVAVHQAPSVGTLQPASTSREQ